MSTFLKCAVKFDREKEFRDACKVWILHNAQHNNVTDAGIVSQLWVWNSELRNNSCVCYVVTRSTSPPGKYWAPSPAFIHWKSLMLSIKRTVRRRRKEAGFWKPHYGLGQRLQPLPAHLQSLNMFTTFGKISSFEAKNWSLYLLRLSQLHHRVHLHYGWKLFQIGCRLSFGEGQYARDREWSSVWSTARELDRHKGAVKKKIAPTATKKVFVAVGAIFFTAPFRHHLYHACYTFVPWRQILGNMLYQPIDKTYCAKLTSAMWTYCKGRNFRRRKISYFSVQNLLCGT